MNSSTNGVFYRARGNIDWRFIYSRHINAISVLLTIDFLFWRADFQTASWLSCSKVRLWYVKMAVVILRPRVVSM